MLIPPRELDGMMEFKDGMPLLKPGATKHQQKLFNSFVKELNENGKVVHHKDGSIEINLN